MEKQKKEIEAKGTMELPGAIACLEDLVASLKEGRVCVQHGNESLTLQPLTSVNLEVKARQKKDKESFSLKLSWESRDGHAKDEDDGQPSEDEKLNEHGDGGKTNKKEKDKKKEHAEVGLKITAHEPAPAAH